MNVNNRGNVILLQVAVGMVVIPSIHSVACGNFHHVQPSRQFPDHESRQLEP
jgi:hypothetical protein